MTENCPLGDGQLDALNTCDHCGLWWAKPRQELRTASPSNELATPTLVLGLRKPLSLFFCGILCGAAAAGWGTLLLAFDSVLSDPRSVHAWLSLLIAIPVGGMVAVGSSAALVSECLHWASPSRLDCDSSGMNVRVWETWSGIWASFALRRASIPRHQLRGVTFSISQGGQHQLFIVLNSGWAFGTGWEGTEGSYLAHARSIQDWLGATATAHSTPEAPGN